jgi:serine phosphatase RsbU (regulator of sigma subunit)
MTIRTKIQLGFVLMLTMFAGFGWFAVYEAAIVSRDLRDLVEDTIPDLSASARLSLALDKLRLAEALHVLEVNAEKMEGERREIERLQALIFSLESDLGGSLTDPTQQTTLHAFADDFNEYVKSFEGWRLLSENKLIDEAFTALQASAPLHERLIQHIAAFDARTRELAQSRSDAGLTAAQEATRGAIGAGIGVTAIFLVLMFFVGRDILRPMSRLILAIDRLASGDLESAIPLTDRRDEVGDVARSLGHFRETAIEKARLQWQQTEDLEFARRVQLASVPQRLPGFSDRTDIDISGRLLPMLAVGGDFFDFYLVDSRHLVISIGDASGKGVGSALLVGMARGALKSGGARMTDAAACLMEANKLIAADNESMMFLTAFYGVLDLESGELSYANAGHPPPYLLDGAGGVRPLPVVTGVPLGIDEAIEVSRKTYRLRPGETVVLYTDGVTEAASVDRGLYGQERLERLLTTRHDESCEAIVARVFNAVQDFSKGEAQSDDIAVLALRFNGPASSGPGAAEAMQV